MIVCTLTGAVWMEQCVYLMRVCVWVRSVLSLVKVQPVARCVFIIFGPWVTVCSFSLPSCFFCFFLLSFLLFRVWNPHQNRRTRLSALSVLHIKHSSCLTFAEPSSGYSSANTVPDAILSFWQEPAAVAMVWRNEEVACLRLVTVVDCLIHSLWIIRPNSVASPLKGFR